MVRPGEVRRVGDEACIKSFLDVWTLPEAGPQADGGSAM